MAKRIINEAPADHSSVELQGIRAHVGFSQEHFALCLGVSRGSLSRWERGVKPVPTSLLRLARFLSCPERCAACAISARCGRSRHRQDRAGRKRRLPMAGGRGGVPGKLLYFHGPDFPPAMGDDGRLRGACMAGLSGHGLGHHSQTVAQPAAPGALRPQAGDTTQWQGPAWQPVYVWGAVTERTSWRSADL
jgi:DNA-binding XRE family transcriptional regulator